MIAASCIFVWKFNSIWFKSERGMSHNVRLRGKFCAWGKYPTDCCTVLLCFAQPARMKQNHYSSSGEANVSFWGSMFFAKPTTLNRGQNRSCSVIKKGYSYSYNL